MKKNAKNKVYSLKLGKETFKNSICCLGEQFSMILNNIINDTKDMCWYCSDIEYAGLKSIEELFPYTIQNNLCYIENTSSLIKKLQYVDQFSSGVFIAFTKEIKVSWDNNLIPNTEEPEGIQHELGKIEIRAFDYSYFEIYCTNKSILDKLELSISKS